MTKSYPYSYERAHEFPGNNEPATEKQINYILYLSNLDENQNGVFDEILASITDYHGNLVDLTKGQASYVIQCLKGDIEKIDVEIEKVFDEYWKPILSPNGVLNINRVKEILYDYYRRFIQTEVGENKIL